MAGAQKDCVLKSESKQTWQPSWHAYLEALPFTTIKMNSSMASILVYTQFLFGGTFSWKHLSILWAIRINYKALSQNHAHKLNKDIMH